jgi:hypothetical protein
MPYQLKLNTYEEVSPAQEAAAQQRYKKALEAVLGDAHLVLPVYQAFQKIVLTYGEEPDPDLLTQEELLLFQSWQEAERAATIAAFGENRYMGEARFEIEASDNAY